MRLPVPAVSVLAGSGFALTAAFLVIVVFVTVVFFDAAVALIAAPTLLTIVVPVDVPDVPDVLLKALTVRGASLPEVVVAVPRFVRFTGGFGSVLLVFLTPVGLATFPLTIFARLVVAATAAFLKGEGAGFKGD
jgi:hypothetical protein